MSESLVVRVDLADGLGRLREGVPCPYVTGETVDTAFEVLSSHDWAAQVGQPGDFGEVVRRLESLRIPETEADPRGMAGNAPFRPGAGRARCVRPTLRRVGGPAVDLATAEGLRRHASPQPVRYSGAITAESTLGEWRTAVKIRIYGFHQVKVKVGTRGAGRSAPAECTAVDPRPADGYPADANEAWPASELVERVEPLRRFGPTALEQPVPHAQVDALAELRPRLGIPVMLDESLCGFPDAEAAIVRGTADIFNVRISKCGGILASLRIIALARARGWVCSSAATRARPSLPVGRGAAPRQPGGRPALCGGLL